MMTNAEIIFREQQARAERGELRYTGRVAKFRTVTGETVEIREVEPIHTFAKWKELGRVVKKGEHAVASFSIWKQVEKKKEEKTGNPLLDAPDVRMFQKTAHFFTIDQTEPLVERKKA